MSPQPCPMCGEAIQSTARKCRICQEWLPEGWAVRSPASAPSRPCAASIPPSGRSTITIEQTGKRWKALNVLAATLIAVGLLIAFKGYLLIGLPIVIVGCLVRVAAMAGTWWHHG